MSIGTTKTIGELCEQVRGVTYSKEDAIRAAAPGYKPVLRANNITTIGLTFDDLVFVPESKVSARQHIKANDVVIAASSGSIDVVGKAARALTDFDGGFGAFCKVLRPNKNIDAGYFAHFFQTKSYRRRISALAAGANINNLRNEHLNNLEILLPPLPEQRRIAAILEKADTLRAKRREAVAKLDQLQRAVFEDMFGDPVTNPKGWPKATLASLFEIARGGSPRPIDNFITESSEGINWIMISDASEGSKYITATRRRIRPEGAKRSRRVKPGDFLLTNSMSFGRPYIMRTSGCIHDGWLVLSPKSERVNSDFLYSLLGSPAIYAEFARLAPGLTVKNLNIDLVRGVEVPVPTLEKQQAYSKATAAIEKLNESLRLALGQNNALFSSLQQRLFSGRI